MTTSIKLSNVYKIFGARPKGRALTMAKTGVGKDDVQLATDHVIGLHDVSFEVADGEVFVIRVCRDPANPPQSVASIDFMRSPMDR